MVKKKNTSNKNIELSVIITNDIYFPLPIDSVCWVGKRGSANLFGSQAKGMYTQTLEMI